MGSVGKGVTSALTFGLGGKLLSDQKEAMQKAATPPSVPEPVKPKPIEEVPKEQVAPKISDPEVGKAVDEELERNKRQRGRAATVLSVYGDDVSGSTAKATLGA